MVVGTLGRHSLSETRCTGTFLLLKLVFKCVDDEDVSGVGSSVLGDQFSSTGLIHLLLAPVN